LMPPGTIEVIAVPEQILCDNGIAVATPLAGFTTTVAIVGVVLQPFAVGVMVNVTVTGELPVLIKVPLMLPVPLAAIPVTGAVLSLVQLYTAPLPLPLNETVLMAVPEHTVCDEGMADATAGAGFTVTVAVTGVPEQPLAEGVMVNVTVTGEPDVLVNVPVILPVPLAAIPVTEPVLFLVHAYVTPSVVLLSAIVVIAVPEQTDCDAGATTATGAGLTSTEARLVQLLELGVMVNVTYTGLVPVFINEPLMLPEPLFAIPVTEAVLFLVQL
jgi:hypothetical protein